MDFYSTLYAIRGSEAAHEIVDDIVSIQALFAEQMLKDPPSPRSNRVYLPPADAKPLAPMATRFIAFDADAGRPAAAELAAPGR
jgi:hypothetical protein